MILRPGITECSCSVVCVIKLTGNANGAAKGSKEDETQEEGSGLCRHHVACSVLLWKANFLGCWKLGRLWQLKLAFVLETKDVRGFLCPQKSVPEKVPEPFRDTFCPIGRRACGRAWPRIYWQAIDTKFLCDQYLSVPENCIETNCTKPAVRLVWDSWSRTVPLSKRHQRLGFSPDPPFLSHHCGLSVSITVLASARCQNTNII